MNSKLDVAANAKIRRRNPETTRELLLETASKLIAQDGPEGLSVSKVAKEAGLNRGSAYHHFDTREQLINETMDWISNRLFDEIYGDSNVSNWSQRKDSRKVIETLVKFSMENPEFGPTWLHRVFSEGRPEGDLFWNKFRDHMMQFAASDIAETDIDVDVHSFIMLVSIMVWPLWTRSSNATPKQRKELSERFIREVMRMEVYGIVQQDKALLTHKDILGKA